MNGRNVAALGAGIGIGGAIDRLEEPAKQSAHFPRRAFEIVGSDRGTDEQF